MEWRAWAFVRTQTLLIQFTLIASVQFHSALSGRTELDWTQDLDTYQCHISVSWSCALSLSSFARSVRKLIDWTVSVTEILLHQTSTDPCGEIKVVTGSQSCASPLDLALCVFTFFILFSHLDRWGEQTHRKLEIGVMSPWWVTVTDHRKVCVGNRKNDVPARRREIKKMRPLIFYQT